MKKEQKLCNNVKTVIKIAYLGDRMVQVEDARLLRLQEQNDGWESLGNVLSYGRVRVIL